MFGRNINLEDKIVLINDSTGFIRSYLVLQLLLCFNKGISTKFNRWKVRKTNNIGIFYYERIFNKELINKSHND